MKFRRSLPFSAALLASAMMASAQDTQVLKLEAAPAPEPADSFVDRGPGRYAKNKRPMSQPKRRLNARRTHPHGF